MLARLVSRSVRTSMNLVLAALILAVVALALPAPVGAYAMSFQILSVKVDESVTIRTTDFPADVLFTVRMDKAGNAAVDGIVVGELKSGSGGSIEATYKIPAELRGLKTIAIRFESERGYYAYNWFNNKNQTNTGTGTGSGSGTGSVPNTGGTPNLRIQSVERNKSVTVEARNLPTNTYFKVRVGPYYTFSKEGVEVATVNSGSSGTIVFTVDLPSKTKDVELIAIRMDGNGRTAYNAFKNYDANNGSTGGSTTNPTTGSCQITAVNPGSSVSKGGDFDGSWTVKNTSGKDWEMNTLDYKYVSGTKMQTNGDIFDLNTVVKSGDSIKIVVDMLAPKDAGTYTTSWALVRGGTTVCNLNLTVRVK